MQGHLPAATGHVATWIYLTFAFVVLPVFVPVAILVLEPGGRRRVMMVPFVALGAVVAGVLLAAMVRGPVTAELGHHYVGYSTDLHAGGLVVMLYVLATCESTRFRRAEPRIHTYLVAASPWPTFAPRR